MTRRLETQYHRPGAPPRKTFWTGLAVLGVAQLAAWGLPAGEQVASGTVTFERDGNSLIIHQESGKAIVNYGSFNIGGSETVRFNQPGSSAAILNRVTGGGASRIAGSLEANGNVYLINPSGILFAPGSRVNVHGLVASGLNMSDSDFKSGNLRFSGGGGKVVNQGSIKAGFAYLVGGSVKNDGTIRAGDIALAAGKSVVIDEAGGGKISLIIDGEETDLDGEPLTGGGDDDTPPTEEDLALADASGDDEDGDAVNAGNLNANGLEGGTISVGANRVAQNGTASADGTEGGGGAIDLISVAATELGPLSKTSADAGLNGDGGEIIAFSDGYTAAHQGAELTARGGSQSGNGGFVEVSGIENVHIRASVDTSAPEGNFGTLLIDPTDIDIVSPPTARNGSFVGPNPFRWVPTGTTSDIDPFDIENLLQNNSVIISTESAFNAPNGGTIRILEPIDPTFNQAVNLSFIADNQILVNADVGGFSLSNPLNISMQAKNGVIVDRTIASSGGTIFIDGNSDNNNDGDVDLTQRSSVSSGGGDITIRGHDVFARNFIASDNADIMIDALRDVNLSGVIDAGERFSEGDGPGGNIQIKAGNNVAFATLEGGGIFTQGNGQIFICADSDNSGAGDIFSTGGFFDIATMDGNIYLDGQSIDLFGAHLFTSPNQAISIAAADTIFFEHQQIFTGVLLAEADNAVQLLRPVNTAGFIGVTGGNTIQGMGTLSAPVVGLHAGGDIGSMILPVSINPQNQFYVQSDTGGAYVSNVGTGTDQGRFVGPDLSLALPPNVVKRVARFNPTLPELPPPPPPNTPDEPRLPPPPPPLEPPPLDLPPPFRAELARVPRQRRIQRRDHIFVVPGADNDVGQLYEFYFLHEYMVVSEFAMEMDLNFTDYIHFGSARIEADASFPTEAKKVIYFGGAKPYHVYRSTKTNPN